MLKNVKIRLLLMIWKPCSNIAATGDYTPNQGWVGFFVSGFKSFTESCLLFLMTDDAI